MWRQITPLGSWASHWTIPLVLREEPLLRVTQTWLAVAHAHSALIGCWGQTHNKHIHAVSLIIHSLVEYKPDINMAVQDWGE